MKAVRLALAGRVGCEIYFVILLNCLRKLFDGCFLILGHDILRFISVFYVNAQ